MSNSMEGIVRGPLQALRSSYSGGDTETIYVS